MVTKSSETKARRVSAKSYLKKTTSARTGTANTKSKSSTSRIKKETKATAKTPSAGRKRSSSRALTQDRVSQIAYELYQLRGGVHGFDQIDWQNAIRLAELEVAATKRKVAKATDNEKLIGSIQELAYKFFEQRGCQHGFDYYDWTVAERIVKQSS